ncbi:MAG: PD-(D/E)XK nuclease family transposase [Oscillospiraceae bacterium]|nr:PD-(D/E)XK nuclease family transposase [Oscillospiraceae bacterium]
MENKPMADASLRLSFDDHFRPCNDVVFSIMFAGKELFTKLVSSVTGNTVELIGEPHSQASLREDDVLLREIRFDTLGLGADNRFYTADMQRSYTKARQVNRTVIYASRMLSTQPVEKMHYEDIKPVTISFVYTDHDEPLPVEHVRLMVVETHRVYSELLEITTVYVPAVLRTADKNSDLYIFAGFFAVSNMDEAARFSEDYSSTDLGRELIRVYNNALANMQNLRRVEKSPYFTERLNEAQLEEERILAERKGILKGKLIGMSEGKLLGMSEGKIEIALNMIRNRESDEKIMKYTSLSSEEIQRLKGL